MTEEDIAKMAYAEIIKAVREIREDMSQEDGEKFVVHFPESIQINKTIYKFSKSLI